MRIDAPAFGQLARSASLGLILSLHAVAAFAGPEEPFDPILQLIAEKGHVGEAVPSPAAAGEPGLLRKVHDKASDMVVAALGLVGVRYQRGGTSADGGFDCSGFTRHVFETSLGLILPRKVDEQATAPGLVAVRRDELRPGDLVFFNTLRRTFSHVGIHIGDDRFIHAPRSGKLIRTESMNFAYWSDRFTGARRVLAALPPESPAFAAPADPADAAATAP
ncbi:MAG TPA: C40 family peptidase [Caldimonas sp.]|jgi:cell wall-associated NlpC family hydrolase|nr:C40 family peptidase [Caldimonas sp.]HEX2540998.1 C40 family peptidase [Caldimonas sp.]